MFLCWCRHHIKPSDFYGMSEGEKLIINAFIEKEFELEKEKQGG